MYVSKVLTKHGVTEFIAASDCLHDVDLRWANGR